jgi:hypothetical protein
MRLTGVSWCDSCALPFTGLGGFAQIGLHLVAFSLVRLPLFVRCHFYLPIASTLASSYPPRAGTNQFFTEETAPDRPSESSSENAGLK